MDIKRVFKPGSMLLGCFLLAGNAHASTVFTGSVNGYFDNPVAGHSDYIDIDNGLESSVFNWGLTHYDRKKRHKRGYLPPESSNFVFESVASGSSGSGFSVNVDQAFLLGDFTYTNEATYLSRHVKGVDFSLALELDGYGSTEFTYELGMKNTPNHRKRSSDMVYLKNVASSQSLQFGDNWYELEILGFSRDGGNSFETLAWLDEGASISAGIYGQLNTISAVPVPAAAWLFGSGILWLAALARKPVNRKR